MVSLGKDKKRKFRDDWKSKICIKIILKDKKRIVYG
jgi:hypothetical protein